jgi:hypothetical protein
MIRLAFSALGSLMKSPALTGGKGAILCADLGTSDFGIHLRRRFLRVKKFTLSDKDWEFPQADSPYMQR